MKPFQMAHKRQRPCDLDLYSEYSPLELVNIASLGELNDRI